MKQSEEAFDSLPKDFATLTHKDLKEGDVIAAESHMGLGCFRILKISRSWFRRRRPFLVMRTIYVGYKGLTMDLRQDLTGKKLWCSAEEIDGTLNLPKAFVQRDGKQVEREET